MIINSDKGIIIEVSFIRKNTLWFQLLFLWKRMNLYHFEPSKLFIYSDFLDSDQLIKDMNK